MVRVMTGNETGIFEMDGVPKAVEIETSLVACS